MSTEIHVAHGVIRPRLSQLCKGQVFAFANGPNTVYVMLESYRIAQINTGTLHVVADFGADRVDLMLYARMTLFA